MLSDVRWCLGPNSPELTVSDLDRKAAPSRARFHGKKCREKFCTPVTCKRVTPCFGSSHWLIMGRAEKLKSFFLRKRDLRNRWNQPNLMATIMCTRWDAPLPQENPCFRATCRNVSAAFTSIGLYTVKYGGKLKSCFPRKPDLRTISLEYLKQSSWITNKKPWEIFKWLKNWVELTTWYINWSREAKQRWN